MEILSAKHTVNLTDQDFGYLVDTAGYGINYWVDAPAYVDEEDCTYTIKHPLEPRYQRADRLFDLERLQSADRYVTVLTKRDLEHAIECLLNGQVSVDPRLIGYIREDDIDSDAADVIIQTAVYGKLVFG